MKGCGNLITLSDCNNTTVNFSQNINIRRKHLTNVGSPNKGHGHFTVNAFHPTQGMEAAQLPAIGIAHNIYVHRTETITGLSAFLPCQKNEACTGG